MCLQGVPCLVIETLCVIYFFDAVTQAQTVGESVLVQPLLNISKVLFRFAKLEISHCFQGCGLSAPGLNQPTMDSPWDQLLQACLSYIPVRSDCSGGQN